MLIKTLTEWTGARALISLDCRESAGGVIAIDRCRPATVSERKQMSYSATALKMATLTSLYTKLRETDNKEGTIDNATHNTRHAMAWPSNNGSSLRFFLCHAMIWLRIHIATVICLNFLASPLYSIPYSLRSL